MISSESRHIYEAITVNIVWHLYEKKIVDNIWEKQFVDNIWHNFVQGYMIFNLSPLPCLHSLSFFFAFLLPNRFFYILFSSIVCSHFSFFHLCLFSVSILPKYSCWNLITKLNTKLNKTCNANNLYNSSRFQIITISN